jgi:hypothetical protein
MFKVLIPAICSLISINAFSGEAENISACVNKSKEFSGVVLNEFNVKYEGNLLARSVAKWENALCEIKLGKVFTLEVNGTVYIYEGFAGKKSYEINNTLQAKTNEAIGLLNSRIALLQQRASQVSASLAKPNPDHQHLINYVNQGIEQSIGKNVTSAAIKSTANIKTASAVTPSKASNSTKALAKNESEVLIPRSIAGDQGKYYLISSNREGDVITTLHKRVGLASIDYTKSEINCTNMMYRVIGYSEISANAVQARTGEWSDLVQGSSKSDLVNFVCS